MKKYLLIVLILLCIGNHVSAQNAMAKLKYEDAEISYTKKDFKSALASLKEAEGLLKSTNPKLLHLKILTMSNMLNTLLDFRFDPEYVAEVKKDCAYYLKTYENVPNNEDKYREVYEVSKSINNHNQFGKMLINAQRGDDKSQDSLGVVYINRKRTDRSTYWFNKAIAAGNIEAMYHLANFYISEKDEKSAIKYYEMAANKGDSKSMYYLGMLTNQEKSAYWYNKAADAGNLVATSTLGLLYLNGDNTFPQCDSMALSYFNRAIVLTPKSKRDTTYLIGSYYYLIDFYYYGDNIPKDYKKVEEYAHKTIALKSKDTNIVANSIIHLADIYRTGGYGIQQNYQEAFTFYSNAQEDGQGCYGLALLYKDGLDVKKDRSKAQEYTQKAITLLTKDSENNRGYLAKLEELYREGILVSADPKKADEYKAKIDAIVAKKSKN